VKYLPHNQEAASFTVHKKALYFLGTFSIYAGLLCASLLQAQEQNHNPVTPTSSANPTDEGKQAPRSFVFRLADAYKEDWFSTLPAGPDPQRRGYPAPLDSPPFPGADFSIGGTPTIGAPDTQSYTLMQAINENKSRIKVYGWLNGSFNVSTSNRGLGANAPAGYDVNPNRLTADQQVLYIERLPNTVQKEHFDWASVWRSFMGRTIATPRPKAFFRNSCWQGITSMATIR
jgi:hypothetical protein